MSYLRLMRVNKPIPILLILWPTYWALWVASEGIPSVGVFVIFTLGVISTRSLGCVLNDLFDRNFDGKVERTKHRPLASNSITIFAALSLSFMLLLISFLLVLQLNLLTVLLSFIAVGLMVLYPLLKRFFCLPQLFLGVTFNFGVVMAFSAITNNVSIKAFFLYFIVVIWTLAYDTIYAISDLPYDKKLNLKSSAILFGDYLFFIIGLLQATVTFLLICFGLYCSYNFFYYTAVLASVLFYIFQYRLYKTYRIEDCIKAFSNNHWVGFVIFVGITLQYLK
jgi:4-hydroxybenzoate polyprenyltransferase